MKNPNVLLIVTDCFRSDFYLKEIGNADTPFFDSIRAEGITFPSIITTASFTTPSFSSLFTGNYITQHGIRTIHGQTLNTDTPTLASYFRDHGYHTYAYPTGPLFEEAGLNQGFDEYHYRDRNHYLDTDWGKDLNTRFRSGTHKEPWFVMLHLWELHQPRRSPQTGLSGWAGQKSYEYALTHLDMHLRHLWQAAKEGSIQPVMGALTGDHGEFVEESVLSGIIRKFRARLRRLTSHNVPLANWHGFQVYDYLVRVPLTIWGADTPNVGTTHSQQVRQIDIFPTLAQAAGIPVPEFTYGQSVWPRALGEKLKEQPAFFEASGGSILLQTDNWVVGTRQDGWKYIYAPKNPDRKGELFDLTTDPGEKVNLASKETARVATLRTSIERDYLSLENAQHDTPEPVSSEEVEKRLRDLGYM